MNATPSTFDMQPSTLSQRERQALEHIGRGYTQKEAAFEMGIAASTLRVLLFRATRKLRGDLLQSRLAS